MNKLIGTRVNIFAYHLNLDVGEAEIIHVYKSPKNGLTYAVCMDDEGVCWLAMKDLDFSSTPFWCLSLSCPQKGF